jgi:hypothetical protein
MRVFSSKSCINALGTELEVVDGELSLCIVNDELDTKPILLIGIKTLGSENLAILTIVGTKVV